jgi:hypothetical protein
MRMAVFSALAFASMSIVLPAHSETILGFEYDIHSKTYSPIPIPSPATYTFPTGIHFPGSLDGINGNQLVAMNAHGQVIGTYTSPPVGPYYPLHSFIYTNGVYTSLDAPGAFFGVAGSGTLAMAINDAGVVAGAFYTGNSCCNSNTPYLLGFLFDGGLYTSLQFPNSAYTNLQHISATGDVAGLSDSGSFVYSEGVFTVIKPPIPEGMRGGFIAITGFSQDGDLLGYYSISPVPEPSTWAMLLVGFAGIGFAAYRRRLTATMPRR